MHKLMAKMMEKKKGEGKGMSHVAQKAKLGVVESLKQMAEDAMKDRGLKKVSVASNSPEGLQEGLEMAKHKVMDMSEDHEAPDSESEDGTIQPVDEMHDMLEDAEYGKAHGDDMLSGGSHGMHGDTNLQAMKDDHSDQEEHEEDMDDEDEDEASIDAKLAHLMEKKKRFQK